MKTLLRIFLIALAVAAVVGGTIALARTGALSALSFGGRGGEFGEFRQFNESGAARPAFPDFQRVEGQRGLGEGGFRGGPRGEHLDGGIFGLAEVGKNLVIMGVIVAAVVAGSLTLNWIRRPRPA
ncbi:MAG: hypothetical protein JNK29_07095 [Anaerolineales bacterium]|nr:hypothetical protein [Anaerolineales bacterium]